MSGKEPPHWIVDFQVKFSRVLRTPLDFRSGELRADVSRYQDIECLQISHSQSTDAVTGLSVYNRQYWFRFFSVMQGEFLLTSRLLGLWQFNQLIQEFLIYNPPQHFDIQRSVDGFIIFLQTKFPNHESFLSFNQYLTWEILLKSAELDSVMQKVFLAPEEISWRPSPNDAQNLHKMRLKASQSFVIFDEDVPLVHLRESLTNDISEDSVPVPSLLSEVQSWAIFRKEQSIGLIQLKNTQARLYRLLSHLPIGHALALLEAECPGEYHTQLQKDVAHWIALRVDYGFWTGAEY